MKKRISLLLIMILSLSCLSGCWDYVEYENMAQIVALGFDFDKDTKEYILSLQYISTTKGVSQGSSEGGKMGSSKQGIVNSARDSTIFGALSKLQQVIYRRLFYGYLKAMVIGEEAAKYTIHDIVEVIDRTPALRTSSFVTIIPGRAEDVLNISSATGELSSGQQIYNLISLSPSTGVVFPITFQDFEEMLATSGVEAATPTINIAEVELKKENSVILDGDTTFGRSRKGELNLGGIAAFNGEKFVGYLNDEESLGYGFLSGKKVISYKTSIEKEGETFKDALYYRISKSKTKKKVKIEDGEPVFNIEVKVTADLRKYYSDKEGDYLFPEVVDVLEKKLSQSIETDMKAALKKVQKELKTDIFGFGFTLFRKSPKLWNKEYKEKWGSIFPDVKVNIKVEAKVINTDNNINKFIIK